MMALSKRQQKRSKWHLTHLTAAFAAAICFASLVRRGAFSNCDDDVNNMKVDNLRQLNGQKRTPSLSSRQSYEFFDDITDDSWTIMQERARSSSSYSNPENPEEGSNDQMYWYMGNLQVR
jgi:hypothetical protein